MGSGDRVCFPLAVQNRVASPATLLQGGPHPLNLSPNSLRPCEKLFQSTLLSTLHLKATSSREPSKSPPTIKSPAAFVLSSSRLAHSLLWITHCKLLKDRGRALSLPTPPHPQPQALGNYLQLNEEQPLSTLRCFFSIPPLLILSTPLAIFLLFKPGFSPTNLFISQAVIKHHCVPRAGPDPQGLERGGGEVSGVQGRGQCHTSVGTTA